MSGVITEAHPPGRAVTERRLDPLDTTRSSVAAGQRANRIEGPGRCPWCVAACGGDPSPGEMLLGWQFSAMEWFNRSGGEPVDLHQPSPDRLHPRAKFRSRPTAQAPRHTGATTLARTF
jgi:hypothetical protein